MRRLAYFMVQQPEEKTTAFIEAIRQAKTQMRFCSVCFNLWLLARINDDYFIDLFWLMSLFYYVLNDGLIQNRQQL